MTSTSTHAGSGIAGEARTNPLSFATMTDIRAHIESLDGDRVQSRGQWTPAQNVQHVALLIGFSLDGFDPGARAPAPLRAAARLVKKRMLRQGFKPGIRLPDRLRSLLPDEHVAWDDAVAQLRRVIGRIEAGERMTARSPIFGRLTHDEWVALQCRHAEMHFSFLSAPPA